MRKILCGILLIWAGTVCAQDATPTVSDTPVVSSVTAAPTPTVLKKWSMALAPWDDWFKSNAMVTDKTDYVHFFWNAQDFKANFEVKDKKLRLEEAALQLVSRLYPSDAKADVVKVDIVYVLERDSYGQPKWDSLQQVAHFEFLRSKSKKLAEGKKDPSVSALKKLFVKSEFF
jgi:hypothetical protein